MFGLTFAALSLLGLSAVVSASPTDPPATPDPVICPFDGTVGPNLLLANVTLPDGHFEINAWIYGLNWCSHANLISKANNDICDLPPTGQGTAFEYLHAPLFTKFGRPVPGCYANFDVLFEKCSITETGSRTDYGGVVATFKSKDGKSRYTYQCVQDSEYHGCVYDGQVSPVSEAKYEAFLTCGIAAEP
ncbi:uncharacterized protein MYCFIDRAFT_85220 [Pseudocercospora fijiensis CIRAD86]|uniref:AA1-like domain-containing protein n=1 Tax=Pseudocercospora fijiensis (strain CIRAD86) TaxID=383855 RepID=M2ZP06_PSEFD|nr:uncharacterized protein MYCFIDRAFT_85220 [Pseudocercospora fijiensis CIRAD86]EME80824.1 hypothetical protein MYCFIDRAFT_85220 [Pseudocercospora fijiensis CIRAD86]